MERHVELKAKQKKIQAIEFSLILEGIDFQIEGDTIRFSPIMPKKVIKKILKKYDFNLKKIDIYVVEPDFKNIKKMKDINALDKEKEINTYEK